MTRIDYTYDFGDNLEHSLIVSDVHPGDPEAGYPRFISGEQGGSPRIVAASQASTKCL